MQVGGHQAASVATPGGPGPTMGMLVPSGRTLGSGRSTRVKSERNVEAPPAAGSIPGAALGLDSESELEDNDWNRRLLQVSFLKDFKKILKEKKLKNQVINC